MLAFLVIFSCAEVYAVIIFADDFCRRAAAMALATASPAMVKVGEERKFVV